jgi:hypothetical protein
LLANKISKFLAKQPELRLSDLAVEEIATKIRQPPPAEVSQTNEKTEAPSTQQTKTTPTIEWSTRALVPTADGVMGVV